MSDEHRLLEAIIASPDDDAPRLVYADVLQGRGDPRGELIQLQCQLAAAPDDDRRRKIKIAENKLLAAHADAWLQPLHDLLPTPPFPDSHKFELVRGFVEEATITLACLPRLDALFAAAPLLRKLRITPNGFTASQIAQPRLDGALASSQFERITSLALALPGGGNTLVREVAEAPALQSLRELVLSGSAWGEMAGFFDVSREKLIIDDTGAAELALSKHLAGLERLHLEGNRLTLEGVRAIGAGAWRLRELDLSNNPLESEGIAFALSGPALRELEVLRLTNVAISATEAAALAASPTLACLRELDLESCHLGAQGTAAFCKAFALPALRRLRIERNSLGDGGALALASCVGLRDLTSLEAGHNRMGHKGGAALAASPHLANLERLLLNEPRWKPETAQLFAESPSLAKTRIYLKGKLVARTPARPPGKKKK